MKKKIISIFILCAVVGTFISACSPAETISKVYNRDYAGLVSDAAEVTEEIATSEETQEAVNSAVDTATEAIGDALTDSDESTSEDNSFTECTFVRAKDGDTIVVTINGEETTIRMIGINTPESVSSDESKNCEEGEEASAYTKSLLTKGDTLYLEYDEDCYDDYGRTLAYVWLSSDVDTTSYEDFCTYNVGALIMQNTYCEAVYYEPNGKYKTWYEQLDSEYQTDTSWRD